MTSHRTITAVLTSEDTLDPKTLSRLFNVPPWVIYAGYPRPRFPRLRWALRRVWPL